MRLLICFIYIIEAQHETGKQFVLRPATVWSSASVTVFSHAPSRRSNSITRYFLLSVLSYSQSRVLHPQHPSLPGQPICTLSLDASFYFFPLPSHPRMPSILTSPLSPPLAGSQFGTQAAFSSLASSPESHSATGVSAKTGSK